MIELILANCLSCVINCEKISSMQGMFFLYVIFVTENYNQSSVLQANTLFVLRWDLITCCTFQIKQFLWIFNVLIHRVPFLLHHLKFPVQLHEDWVRTILEVSWKCRPVTMCRCTFIKKLQLIKRNWIIDPTYINFILPVIDIILQIFLKYFLTLDSSIFNNNLSHFLDDFDKYSLSFFEETF